MVSKIPVFLIILFQISCSSVKIASGTGTQMGDEPSFEKSVPFFFWGLVSKHKEIATSEICFDKEVFQVETFYARDDVLATFFTLGIYSPRSVRIWCGI